MKFLNYLWRFSLLGSVVTFLPTGQIYASGFALIENSASGQGNAYAGAAAHVTDGSTVFFNPAGMMKLEKDHFSIAGHYIKPKASFQNKGSTSAPTLGSTPLSGGNDNGGANAIVPNLYWVKSIDEQTKFGLGVQTLFGLATKYDDSWVGRYHAVETDLKTLNINPSMAYRLNSKLSLGGGINVVVGDIIFTNAIDFGAICAEQGLESANCAPQKTDGFATLTGDNLSSPGLGFNLGLQYMLAPETTLGVSYRSQVDLKFKGKADFKVPTGAAFITSTGRFNDGAINAAVTLPASLAMSVAHNVGKMTYLADVTWMGWSSFDELRIVYDKSTNPGQPDSVTTENWEDVYRYSVGFDYQYTDKMVLRSGVAYDQTPVPNIERRTPRVPDNARTWLSFGLTYRVDETLTLDAGYSHLFVNTTKIENQFESSVPTMASTLTGEYQAAVDILSVQLNWNY